MVFQVESGDLWWVCKDSSNRSVGWVKRQGTDVCWVWLFFSPLKHIFHCGFQSKLKSTKTNMFKGSDNHRDSVKIPQMCFFLFLASLFNPVNSWDSCYSSSIRSKNFETHLSRWKDKPCKAHLFEGRKVRSFLHWVSHFPGSFISWSSLSLAF